MVLFIYKSVEIHGNQKSKSILSKEIKKMSEYEIKKQICEIGKRIYDKGMVASNDGNNSLNISDNEFLCTPRGVS